MRQIVVKHRPPPLYIPFHSLLGFSFLRQHRLGPKFDFCVQLGGQPPQIAILFSQYCNYHQAHGLTQAEKCGGDTTVMLCFALATDLSRARDIYENSFIESYQGAFATQHKRPLNFSFCGKSGDMASRNSGINPINLANLRFAAKPCEQPVVGNGYGL